MVATDYELEGSSDEANFAYKVHSVLEGLGDNETEFGDEENLTQKVSEFYNGFSEYVGGTGTSPRFIERNFEVFLEEEDDYDTETRLEAVSRLIREPSTSDRN